MKLRLTLLVFVSVLLVGSLAGAATADPAGATAAVASPAPEAVASPVVGSLCVINISKAELPAVNPAVNPVVLKTTSICGACSDIWCQGQTLGALCRTGKRCYNLYANFCAQDGQSQCTCYSGQLP